MRFVPALLLVTGWEIVCVAQPLTATSIFTPFRLGDMGETLTQNYLTCTQTNPSPSTCKEAFLASLDLELAALLPSRQPLPEEARAAGYVDLINFETQGISKVSIGIYEKYEACKAQGLSNCEDKDFVFDSVYWPRDEAKKAEENIDEAWEAFVKAVANDVHEALNKDPACFVGGTPQCVAVVAGDFPIPDPVCITTRITQA
jgi:hypothetical protein